MQHSFLKTLEKAESVNCVYYLNFKLSDIDKQLLSPRRSKNGNPYILLRIRDNSLAWNESASVFFYFSSESQLEFLKNRSPYVLISGRVWGEYPNIAINANNVTSAGMDSGIVFDTGDLYAFDPKLQAELLSPLGKTGVRIRHTIIDEFQDNSDLIQEGMRLKYKRIHGSPYDRYQINVFIDGLDEVFNIPAWVTPTMATLIDQGYVFDIVVTAVTGRDEENGINAGLAVSIRGRK